MSQRLKTVCAAMITMFLLPLGGCTLFQSPAVGKWSGPMKSSPSGGFVGAFVSGITTAAIGDSPANLELRSDGTGYLKLPAAPDRQITWKADGDKVLLYGVSSRDGNSGSTNGSDASSSPSPDASPSDNDVIGTISDDHKTLTFDLGPIEFVLTRQDN